MHSIGTVSNEHVSNVTGSSSLFGGTSATVVREGVESDYGYRPRRARTVEIVTTMKPIIVYALNGNRG